MLSLLRWCHLFVATFAINLVQARTWTDVSGRTLEADYLSHTEAAVEVRRTGDGLTFQIPLENLSQADRDWLATQHTVTSEATDKGIYIAVGNGLHRMSSNDGRVWTNHVFKGEPKHDQNDLKAIAVGNGACVTVGGFSRSNILTTTDGVEWHISTFNIGVLSGVIFVDGYFHVFGEGGRVARSQDGFDWTEAGKGDWSQARNFDMRAHLKAEAASLGLEKNIKSNIRRWRFANGTFVGAGDNCIIVSTTDFKDWRVAERIEPRSRLSIESDGQGFVVRGRTTIHHSTDGVTWTDVTPQVSEKTEFRSLVYDGARYLINERQGNGWESAKGTEWTSVAGARFPKTLAALRPDLLYSFETYWKPTQDMQVSTDGGKNWESVELPAPAGVTNIIHAARFPQF
ncbi:MAG: hypothetical protein ACFBZ8_03930 [Opitutales bacterium]